MKEEMQKKTNKWINVLDYGFDNTGNEDAGRALQEFIDRKYLDNGELIENSVLYFPKGTYLFETEVEINIQVTLQGDPTSQAISMGEDSPDLNAGCTKFITRVKDKDFVMIRLCKKKQCIKNIHFYSDSCKIKINNEPPVNGKPGYHYEIVPCKAKISAIFKEHMDDTTGLGHYEDLYISGFSGTGIVIPYFAIADNITVSNCGLGIRTQSDTLVSNCRVSYCGNGMSIGTGTSLNNVRVEKIQMVGIESPVGQFGSYKLNNITIDECGHCGFKFASLFVSYISGIIRRCGQYFYNTDYETYCKLLEEMDQEGKETYKDAYSMIYGTDISGSEFDLVGGNTGTWNEEEEGGHQVYILTAVNVRKVILRCNEDSLDQITSFQSGSLVFYNNFNNYIFYNGILEQVNGINVAGNMKSGLLKLKYSAPDSDYNIDTVYMVTEHGDKKLFHPGFAMIVASTDPDITKIEKTYGLRCIFVYSEIVGSETIYHYKIIYPGK